MGHANYFRSKLQKEDNLEILASIMNELSSKVQSVNKQLDKAPSELQKINLTTELKALKLVLATGSSKIKGLKKN